MISKKEIYIKNISRNVFWTQLILFTISFSALFAVFYYSADLFYKETASIEISKVYPAGLQDILSKGLFLKDGFYLYIWPALGAAIIFFTILSWLIIKSTARKNIEKIPSGRISENREKGKKEDPELEKRKFLHLLSVLQEEGRFLDFLNEDLSAYEDDDIGAAVRSVHKGCRESLEKYMELKPLLEEEEESEIEIKEGFNTETVKLTGNVVGEPPFKGVVIHRGWMAENLKMPELKKVSNASYLVPAEIEVK